MLHVAPVACVKTEEPATVESHEQLGTARIGTLRNHASGTAAETAPFLHSLDLTFAKGKESP